MIGKKENNKTPGRCTDLSKLTEEQLKQLRFSLGLSEESVELTEQLSSRDMERLKQMIRGNNVRLVLNQGKENRLNSEELLKKLPVNATIEIDTSGLEAHRFVTEEYFIRYGHYIDKPALIASVGQDNLQASYLNVDFFYTDTKQYVGTIKLNVFSDLLRHDLNARDSYLSYNVAQNQGWGFNASNWKASSILKEKGKGVIVRLRKEGVFTNYSIRSTRQINIGELYLDHQDMVFAKENIKYLFLVGERKDFVMTHLEVDDIPCLNAEGFQLKPIYVFRNEDNGSYDLTKQRIVSVGNRLSIYKENVLDNGVIYSFPTSGLRSYYRFELYDSTTNELIHQWDAQQESPSLKSYYRWDEHPGLFKVKLWTVETRELKKQHRANAFQGIIEKLNRISPVPIEDTEETTPITGRYLQDNEEMTPAPETFEAFKADIINNINRHIETGESFSRFKLVTYNWVIYTWILYCLDPEQFSNYREIDEPIEYSLMVDDETVFTVIYSPADPPHPDGSELETEELEEEQD